MNMATTRGLYLHLNSPRIEEKTRRINLIAWDIDVNPALANEQLFQVKTFSATEVDAWFDCITSGIDEIHLLLSNRMCSETIRMICKYPQIKSLFILRKYAEHENYPNERQKIKGTFDTVERMFEEFREDVHRNVSLDFRQQVTFQKVEAEISWWQFFQQVLLRLQPTNIAKEEFLDFLRETHQTTLRDIEEIERRYTFGNGIYWYTRSGIIYTLINRTLRTKNVNEIFRIRYFLADLLRGLQNARAPGSPPTVYRGQSMTLEDIDRLKHLAGNLICFNQFLSATSAENIASIFALHTSDHSLKHPVISVIETGAGNAHHERSLWASIKHLSYFPAEDEVLFSMHSIFLVQSVRLQPDGQWEVRLKLQDTLDTEQTAFNPYNDQLLIDNPSRVSSQTMGYQILLDMILRVEPSDYAKRELMEYSRGKCPMLREQIEAFERVYRSENALHWYRKGTFLYQILHGEMNINVLITMRSYIQDLHQQLDRLQSNFIASLNNQTHILLYHGQTMKLTQLTELRQNIKKIISMKTFFSATRNRYLANRLSGYGEPSDPNDVSVVYEISLDLTNRSIPYARIPTVANTDEEILFSIGSIFRLQSVQPAGNRFYTVRFTLEQINPKLWTNLTDHLN